MSGCCRYYCILEETCKYFRNGLFDFFVGSISCIRVEFLFQRQIGYYILHAYIPSLTLVALSWVSFWIDIRSAPARVSLGITTILSMLTISNGVKMDLPRVAYVKVKYKINVTIAINIFN